MPYKLYTILYHPINRYPHRSYRKGRFQFHAKYWDHISEGAKQLIAGMLTVDVDKRLTIDQALHHPWVSY